METAVGYVRVSTEEQARDGQSLDAQIEKLRAYASLYEIDLVDIIVDAGESAKTLDRPGLQRTLGMLGKGTVDGILVAKLDRLTRSVADLNRLIEGYFSEKAGRQLWSVSENIDTRSAAGRLVLNILASVSQWEREVIGERTREVLQHKKSKGERVGRIPFGFMADPADPTRLILDPAEQEIIAVVRRLKGEGMSLRAIAAEMNRLGYRTKSSTQWYPTTVQRALAA